MSYNQSSKSKFYEPKEVRLIGLDNKNIGVVSFEEAKEMAAREQCDLIRVSDNVVPPIYKLGDLGKIKYLEDKKKRKEQKKLRKDVEKTIRINFNEGIHDMQVKAKKIDEFLDEGRRVRVTIKLVGREKTHQDVALNKFNAFMSLIKTSFKYFQSIEKTPSGFEAIIIKDEK